METAVHTSESSVAIVPARDGSKRIPGKNIKEFCGKPIIGYTLETLQQAHLCDRIIVSTDSEATAEVAKRYGAEVPFMRPAELADDYATTDAVILHALDWLRRYDNYEPKYACCAYPTAAFLSSHHLRNGLDTLVENKAASAVAVTSFPHPIYRAMHVTASGRLRMIWPENRMVRTRDLPEAYHDAGQFYWLDTAQYREQRKMYGENSVPVFIPRWLVQDTDTPEDWRRAELLYKAWRSSEGVGADCHENV